MKLKGNTWSFFIGYDPEKDGYAFRLYWGGRTPERTINGLYRFAHEVHASVHYPLRYLRVGYFILPRVHYGHRKFALPDAAPATN
jgi:hypothetical protein